MLRFRKTKLAALVLLIFAIITFMLYCATEKSSTFSKRSVTTNEKYQEYKVYKNVSETTVDSFFSPSAVCVPNFDGSSEADIDMYDLYRKLEFNNVPGGAWRQGWNVQTNPDRWSSSNKLKVFIVPHSHNDPGWKKTFEQYYESETQHIFNHMVIKLSEDTRRKFIWAETSYLSLWWSDISDDVKTKFKRLIDNGQIEIVTGGWVMTDEANSHYYSMIQQLTHGHQWLQTNLNVTPKYSWCIDPFGVSPTMPFLLKNLGFEGLVVQRTHYEVKKYLAKNKQLEFRWRQLWDNVGEYDFFTHMMPFYSYDIPHTCGPDPKICCQFDFKRLSWFALFCPWKIAPEIITNHNVAFKAELLLDQYRKKAELYSTNVLLVPLGDDFRYTDGREWDSQFNNYQKIFDYLNSNQQLHVEAQFGTLKDYFESVKDEKKVSNFPSLSGDFFTYSDRDDHYWSGYFTSRPFYKRMDRELMYYLRSAELIYTMAWKILPIEQASKILKNKNLIENIQDARASLSLFQHHDGITGTAADYVVLDYAKRLFRGITNTRDVIRKIANFLLAHHKPMFMTDSDFLWTSFEETREDYISMSSRVVLENFESNKLVKLILFNPLSWSRKTTLNIMVKGDHAHNIYIYDSDNRQVNYQITESCPMNDIKNCFTLHFHVQMKPLQLKTYFVKKNPNKSRFDIGTVLTYYPSAGNEFTLENLKLSVTFNPNGLIKAITVKDTDIIIPIHLNFVEYRCRKGGDMCGAYLFLPDGPAKTIECRNKVIVSKGPIMSQISVSCLYWTHIVTIYNDQGTDDYGIEIRNIIDVRKESNFELAMRFSTNIQNNGVIYTDSNGYQIIKRQYSDKRPLQGNYYPMASSAYIEDERIRLSVLSAQPLGAASLMDGQLEIMQDRILDQSDDLGLSQGVRDNKPTLHVFRLLVETRRHGCQAESEDHHAGYLSTFGYLSLQALLNPIVDMYQLVLNNDDNTRSSDIKVSVEHNIPDNVDIHIVSLTTILEVPAAGVVLHRPKINNCFAAPDDIKFTNGQVNVSSYLFSNLGDAVYSSSLTFTRIGKKLKNVVTQVCPMELTAFYAPLKSKDKNVE